VNLLFNADDLGSDGASNKNAIALSKPIRPGKSKGCGFVLPIAGLAKIYHGASTNMSG
jgi:hypothetical protein